jgi:hypothetical protein
MSSLSSAAMARQARELFMGKAVEILQEAATAVRSKLSSLLDQSANARDAQDRRDAFLAYQKGEAIWVNGVQTAWKKTLLPPTGNTTNSSLQGLNFELMGNDVVENKILSSRLSLRILDKATWELNDLVLRIRQLENIPEIDKRDLLRPEACAHAVVEAWIASGLTREAWLSVQDLVHKALGERMVEAYHDANAFLMAQGVMANIDLRPLVKRTPNAVVPNSGSAELPTEVAPLRDSGADSYPSAQGGASSWGGAYSQGGGQQANGNNQGMGGRAGGGSAGGRAGNGAGNGAGGGQAGMSQAQAGRQANAGLAGRHGATSNSGGGNEGRGGGQAGGATPRNIAQSREAAHEETRMMTSSTPLAKAKMRAQGVLGQLKRMLTDKVVGFDDTRSYGPSPALQAAMAPRGPAYARTQQSPNTGGGVYRTEGGTLAIREGAVAVPPVGFAGFVEGMRPDQAAGALREETNALKKAATTQSEKATIEIVALMFQSILAEERIPAAVRVWFARLQMPVLRLALSEPEFFGSLQHPARRLIDRMGSCVLGFDADISVAALETEIKRVVQVIEQYPETGRRVFQLVYDEFQKFLGKFLVEGAATQRVVSVAQQMEQKETAAIQYTIEMRKLLGDVPLRDEIREFLFKVWAEVMAISSIKYGPQHADTVGLKQVAADLVWAASAKPNRADRAKVIQDLPLLLKSMRAGMGLLGFDLKKQDEHIKIISDTLADAFMSKTQTVDALQIAEMSKRLKNLEDFVSEDDVGDLPIDAESIELMLGIDTSGIDIITSGGSDPTEAMRAWAMELEVGSWFNLDHNSNSARVQYAWRSKRGQLHLFASTTGRTYLFQVRRLAAYLQSGLMTPVEDEALTVRATREALTKLDANPERLLS